MKKTLLQALILLCLPFAETKAQTYHSMKDTLWCCRYFQRLNGDYYAVGNKTGTNGFTPPSNEKVITCYYAQIPKGRARADLFFTTKYGKTANIDIKVIDPDTGDTLCTKSLSGTYQFGTECKEEAIPDTYFPRDCFYRIELTAKKPSTTIATISRFEFQHESTLRIATPNIFMAPSTHLYTWGTTDPEAPTGEAYDWMYAEVLFPSQFHRINSYVMTLGLLAGYSGISTVGETKRHGMLFSQWDNGDTEVDKFLPSYLRSTGLDCGEDWIMKGFGGEGTGVQTVTVGDSPWRKDEWVQFLANCRPEDIEFSVEDQNGNDSVKMVSHNTLVTLWWKQPSDKEWKYISTLRAAGRNQYFSGWYSFVENYTDNGGDLYRRAYYRHGFMRAISTGKWYNRNYCGFGHTDGSGKRGSRFDYGHGRSNAYDNCFYLSTGGFKSSPDDSSKYVSLTDDHTCVDTINLEALTPRIQQAIKKGKVTEMASTLSSARYHLPQSAWSVIGYSDQEESGEGDNGLASYTVDGSEGTYWHSRYTSNRLKTHYLEFKANVATQIKCISLSQGRDKTYRVKTLDVYTSADGKEWQLYQDGLEVPDSPKPMIEIPAVTTQYIKLDIRAGYGSNIVINEIHFRGEYNTERLKNIVKTYIDNAGELNCYRSEDLQNLVAVYDNGNNNDNNSLADALSKLAAEGSPLQFSTVAQIANTGIRRSYVLRNKKGHGTLAVDTTGTEPCLVLRNATIQTANENSKIRMPASDMLNNWSFIRNEKYKTFYIYNLGSGLYLDLTNTETFLSREPVNIDYSTMLSLAVCVGNSGTTILSAKASSDKPFTLGRRDENSMFEILDNQLYTPRQEWADSLLSAACKRDKFEAYKAMVPRILALPEGYVGSLADETQRSDLATLYDNGNIDFTQAEDLFTAIDSLSRIEFKPEETLYRITPSADSPTFLTVDNDGIYSKTATEKPNQIWRFQKIHDNYSPQSQGVAVGTLSDKTDALIGIANKAQAMPLQLATDDKVNFRFCNAANGPTAMANNVSPVKTASYNDNTTWLLEPYNQITVSLNAHGISGAFYDFDVQIPEDLEAFIVTKATNTEVSLQKVEGLLPAHTPAVLRGKINGNYTLQASARQSKPLDSPLLKGTLLKASLSKTKSVYTIMVKSGKPSLSLNLGRTINANQCYVPVATLEDSGITATTIPLDFDGALDGIKTDVQTVTDTDAPVYDLNGRMTESVTKGIYIQDGRKFKK